MTDQISTSGTAVANELNASLVSNYMLITLMISRWSATKKDQALSDELAKQKGAIENSASVSKKLMSGSTQELDELNKSLNAIRTHLYDSSLPWSNSDKDLKGPRIISTKKSIELLKELGALQQDYEACKAKFLRVYENRVDQAMTNLGAMADRSLYPSQSEIGGKFNVTIDLIPVPAVSGFGNMNIPAPLAQALAKRMEKAQSKVVDNAVGELNNRVLECVTKLSDQLYKSSDGEGTRMFDSLSTNLKPLVDLCDTAALAKDKRLLGLKEQIKELSKVDIRKIKKASPEVKRKIAKKADKIIEAINAPQTDVESLTEEVLF